jgi:hypothetical protein
MVLQIQLAIGGYTTKTDVFCLSIPSMLNYHELILQNSDNYEHFVLEYD